MVDWSYETRKTQKLLKFEPNQPKITDYISIPTRVKNILCQHSLKEIQDLDEDQALQFSTELFKKLIEMHKAIADWYQRQEDTVKL